MSSDNEHKHLIGQTVGISLIKNIEYSPSEVYYITDGNCGSTHILTLENGETFSFRIFLEVAKKYGALKKVEPV